MSVDAHQIRERVFAKLDAERPWHVFDFYEVGLIARVRGRTFGDALGRLIRLGHYRDRQWTSCKPPGRYRWHTEPFGAHEGHESENDAPKTA